MFTAIIETIVFPKDTGLKPGSKSCGKGHS
jgi:hypothetical protein